MKINLIFNEFENQLKVNNPTNCKYILKLQVTEINTKHNIKRSFI